MTTSEHSGSPETDPLTKPNKSVRPRIGKLPARKPASWISKILKVLGPGLITGAADDDPSGIATYSSVGAQYGYGMLWTMPFVYPFMAGIQEISARLGRVTGRGIAGDALRLRIARIVQTRLIERPSTALFGLQAKSDFSPESATKADVRINSESSISYSVDLVDLGGLDQAAQYVKV